MKFNYVFIIIFAMSVLVVACEKQLHNDSHLEIAFEQAIPELTITEIKEIGRLHNAILIEAIDGMAEVSGKPEVAFKSAFIAAAAANGLTGYTLSDFEKDAELASEELMPLLKTPIARNYIMSIESAITSSSTVEEIHAKLDFLWEKALKQIPDSKDLTAILLFCEVGKNSAKLWMSEASGGLGYGDKFRSALGSNPYLKCQYCIEKALLADGIAASGYFLGLGSLTALGLVIPGTNAAIGAGVLFSSSWSSGLAWLTCECEN